VSVCRCVGRSTCRRAVPAPENEKTPRIREVCAQSGGVTARYPMMIELIADIADE
jgi:hypothetical protein